MVQEADTEGSDRRCVDRGGQGRERGEGLQGGRKGLGSRGDCMG